MLMSTQYLQALNKLMEEMSCPQKGYLQQGSAVVFSRKERPCNNRKLWEATVPRLPSKAFWKQWLPVAWEYWAGNERLLGGGVPGGADKHYLALLHIDLVGH